jgi:protein-S-isoprenylcysteine O-methyltransferase Ste14
MEGNDQMKKMGEHPFGDAGQLIFLGAFFVVWVGDSFVLHASTFLSKFIPLALRLTAFCAAFITALLLARSAHFVVAHEERPDHVVSTGAFRYIRHPLYLASILTYFGLAVSTASLASLAVFVAILAFYDFIAAYEEKLLEVKMGQAYIEYKKKTGKWLPRIGH